MRFKFILSLLLSIFLSKVVFGEQHNKPKNLNSTINIKSSASNETIDKLKIHIVKEGDTLSSIARIYSINKQLIIKANNLINENYIFIGQNLKIIENISDIDSHDQNKIFYHKVEIGENLTEIANKYELTINELIKINNIENPNVLKVGTTLKLTAEIAIKEKLITNKKKEIINIQGNNNYGPLTINSSKLNSNKRKKILEATHKNGKRLILSINCDKSEINVRGIGRKWKGWMPPKTKFEKQLIEDYC